jgi:hypothetical protein
MAAASAPAAPATDRPSATKTIFGVPAPRLPEKVGDKASEKPADRGAAAAQAAAADPGSQRAERKTGARKTVVPAPAIIPPSGTGEPVSGAPPMAAVATADTSRTTHQGYGGPASAPAEIVSVKAPVMEDRTAPVRAASAKKARGIPVWTYVGVGFLFGLALLGIYQLVGVLAH